MENGVLIRIINDGLDHTIDKWESYFDVYERYFQKYRASASPENKIKILEIGVYHGGSLDLWNKYFGSDNCEIYGIDINPSCADLQHDNIKILIGDQSDDKFLQEIKETLPVMDIIIDDGGHYMDQQIKSFDALFSHVKPGGIYLCEDTHTSYYPAYGGGLHNSTTFVEYSKKFIDKLTAFFYVRDNCIEQFSKECFGIYYHDSMVFFEKALHPIGYSKRLIQKGIR